MSELPPATGAGPKPAPAGTVYYDGSCPICSREIGLYRGLNGACDIAWVDVSSGGCELGPDLSPEQAMARFHVRDASGQLSSRARAFATLWQVLPGLSWAGRIAARPAVNRVLEAAYLRFLPLRMMLKRWVDRKGGGGQRAS